FFENAIDDFGRREHEELLRLELAHGARDLAEDLVGDGLGGLLRAAAAARRTRLAELAFEAFRGALSRHLDEAERRHLVDGRLRVVARERFLELAQHLAAMLLVDHVDEVDDDDAAEIAKAKL